MRIHIDGAIRVLKACGYECPEIESMTFKLNVARDALGTCGEDHTQEFDGHPVVNLWYDEEAVRNALKTLGETK